MLTGRRLKPARKDEEGVRKFGGKADYRRRGVGIGVTRRRWRDATVGRVTLDTHTCTPNRKW